MKYKKQGKTDKKSKVAYSAKECAYIAVFVALVIATQLGVELVTVLFVAYAYAFGTARGMIAATSFSLLRQAVFGVYPKVLVLYLVYYNTLACIFGLIGNKGKTKKQLLFIVLIACVCTVGFTMFDNVLTPLWYGYTKKAARLYFQYSLPVLLPQVVCTAVTTTVLFLPLQTVFSLFAAKGKRLKRDEKNIIIDINS